MADKAICAERAARYRQLAAQGEFFAAKTASPEWRKRYYKLAALWRKLADHLEPEATAETVGVARPIEHDEDRAAFERKLERIARDKAGATTTKTKR